MEEHLYKLYELYSSLEETVKEYDSLLSKVREILDEEYGDVGDVVKSFNKMESYRVKIRRTAEEIANVVGKLKNGKVKEEEYRSIVENLQTLLTFALEVSLEEEEYIALEVKDRGEQVTYKREELEESREAIKKVVEYLST